MSATQCGCGRPTAGSVLCLDCQQTLRWALVNVAAHYLDLGTVAMKRANYGSAGSVKGSIGKAQPLPVDLRFLDAGPPPEDDRSGRPRPATLAVGSQLRWDTWNTMVAWTRTVMEEQPELLGPACGDCLHVSCSQVRRRRWPSNQLPAMTAYLARHFRWIVSQVWAPVLLDELLDLERRLVRMVNRPPDRWYAGKCSATDGSDNTCTAELYAAADRGHIDCRACGTRHDVADRRAFLLEEAKEYRVTASEAADALMAWTDYDGSEHKLIDRIRKWRDRGRLEVQDVTSLAGRDRHLYRLGDIQELLIEHAQRQQQRKLGA